MKDNLTVFVTSVVSLGFMDYINFVFKHQDEISFSINTVIGIMTITYLAFKHYKLINQKAGS